MGPQNPDEDEDYSQFDRVQDWVACFGAFIIISSTLGLLQSYAVLHLPSNMSIKLATLRHQLLAAFHTQSLYL